MRIRREQFEALTLAARDSFEREMMTHLKQFSPRHCEVTGDEAVKTVIRRGMDSSKKYGFTQRGPIRLYLEMMFMFGSEFDTDPQLPWARERLVDQAYFDPMDRAEALYCRASEYLREVDGPDHSYTINALRRINSMERDDIVREGGTLAEVGMRLMKYCYPEKFFYVGPEALRMLIKEVKTVATNYNIASLHGAGVVLTLMYAMGHGVVNDPLAPWVGKTLNDPAIQDPQQKVIKLESKARLYLKNVLAYLG